MDDKIIFYELAQPLCVGYATKKYCDFYNIPIGTKIFNTDPAYMKITQGILRASNLLNFNNAW